MSPRRIQPTSATIDSLALCGEPGVEEGLTSDLALEGWNFAHKRDESAVVIADRDPEPGLFHYPAAAVRHTDDVVTILSRAAPKIYSPCAFFVHSMLIATLLFASLLLDSACALGSNFTPLFLDSLTSGFHV